MTTIEVKQITAVQFRVLNGEVIAVFPYIIEGYDTVLSYARNGQHSACNIRINDHTKPATQAQYEPLIKELEACGYELDIIKRRSTRKFMKAWHNYINRNTSLEV